MSLLAVRTVLIFFFDYIRTKATEMFSAKQKFRKLVISNGKRKQLLLDSKNCVIFHELLAEDEVVHHEHNIQPGTPSE